MLKACFDIVKRVDSRTKKSIVRIYTTENNFSMLFDNDKELEEWLDLMLVLQRVNKDYGHIDSIKEPLGTSYYTFLLFYIDIYIYFNLFFRAYMARRYNE